jgi:hypothetical protein
MLNCSERPLQVLVADSSPPADGPRPLWYDAARKNDTVMTPVAAVFLLISRNAQQAIADMLQRKEMQLTDVWSHSTPL